MDLHAFTAAGIEVLSAFEENPEAIGVLRPVLDDQGRFSDAEIVYENRTARERFFDNAPLAALVGKRLFEHWPQYRALVFEGYARVVAENAIVRHEIHGERPDGEFWSEVMVYPYAGGFMDVGRDITEQRRAQAALKASEARLRATLDTMIDPHVVLEAVRDAGGRIVDFVFTDANQAAADFNRLPLDQLLGVRLLGRHPSAQTTDLFSRYVRIVETGEPFIVDDWSYPQDLLGGELRLYDIRAVRLGDGVSQTWRDVTERARSVATLREARDALAASEERLRAALEATSEGLLLQDSDARVVLANPEGARIMGLQVDELTGATSFDPRWEARREDGSPFPGEEHPSVDTLRTGRPHHDVLMDVTRGDGERIWLQVSSDPIRAADGSVSGAVVSFRDVTAAREAERAFRDSEERFRTMFGEAPLGIALIDSDTGQIYEVNQRFAEIAGRTREEMATIDWMTITHPDDVQPDLDNMARLNRGEVAGFTMEKRYIRPDGSIVWVNMTIAPMASGPGEHRHLCMIEDITERKAAADVVVQARADLAEAQRIAHVGNWTWDPVTDVVTWSDEMFRIVGLPAGSPTPPFTEQQRFFTSESQEQFAAAVANALATGQPWQLEVEIVAADGQHRVAIVRGEVAPESEGSSRRIRGTVVDITEQHVLQQSVAQASRLESLGRLASGVAHDVNNLLYGIEMIGGAIRRNPASPEVADEASEIVDAAGKGMEMTRALLTFAKGGPSERRRIEPGAFVTEAVELIERLLGPAVTIGTAIAPELPEIEVDGSGLRQALINLAVNARDAMPEGGRLTIALDAVELDEDAAKVAGAFTGPYVRLSVTDTGTGIDPAILPRIFEPFFSTKPANIGTGLGLAVTYGFVKANDGGITVESRTGQGTTFNLYLPAA